MLRAFMPEQERFDHDVYTVDWNLDEKSRSVTFYNVPLKNGPGLEEQKNSHAYTCARRETHTWLSFLLVFHVS